MPPKKRKQDNEKENEKENEQDTSKAIKKQKKQKKEKVVRLKKEIQVLLADKWDENKHDPTNWWMSEKLDGLRAYWDGKHFYSRLGHQFPAPDFVLQQMPLGIVLDGELFSKRGEFQTITSIVRSSTSGEKWERLRFHCFDAPELKEPFEERLKFIDSLVNENKHPFLVAHPHQRCRDKDHLLEEQTTASRRSGCRRIDASQTWFVIRSKTI